MKFWPFGNQLEKRESAYSNAVIAALVSRAEGKSLAVPSATAALEACAGTVGRGFAAAEIAGPTAITRALTPSIMEMVGRSLIRVGEVVFLIDTTGGELRLLPTEAHDIEGGPDPESWTYRLDVERAKPDPHPRRCTGAIGVALQIWRGPFDAMAWELSDCRRSPGREAER